MDERAVTVFKPSRRLRREANGTLCDVCPNRVHFSDAVVVVYPFRTAYAHAECVALVAEEAQSALEAE